MVAHQDGSSSPWGPPENTDPISILHVDDQIDFAEMGAEYLERDHERFDVETASSAGEGLDRLSEDGFDCVVSDYQMPGMDGLEFLKAVRGKYPDLPFILFTGKGSEEVAGEAISAGVTDYLQKKSGSDQFTVLANRIENAVHQTRAEHRLEESQRRFRTLLSNVPGMAYRCRNERGWPMHFVSDDCAEITGYERAELENGEISYGRDIIHPDDRDRVWKTVQDALEAREAFRVEYRIKTADRGERWVWEQGQGVFEGGEAVAVEGIITDITERKKREKQLQIYEYATKSALSGIAIADLDGELRSVNPSFAEMWGHDDVEDLIGRSVTDFWADPDAAATVVDSVQQTGHWEGELRAVREDGTTFDAYCSASVVTDDDGEPIGVMSSFVDVTDRKRRVQELEEEREKYATLVKQSHDGVGIIQNQKWAFVNSRLADITGYEESELEGMQFTEIIAPKDQQLVRERYERRLDPTVESPTSRYTLTFETKEGENRDVEISAADIQYEGSVADLVSVRDVTERQQYEDELERLNEQLEVLNRVVRHDIRNDVSVMLGWGELLKEHVNDGGMEPLEEILASGKHIIELTNIARDYVETLTNGEGINVKPTGLQPTLANEIALREEAHPDAEIRIDGTIPDVTVRANEMLSSVFRNLLHNAIIHNDNDTPIVEVTVENREETVAVAVADNGPGIPENQRETIFGKGWRSLESSGTGIGLHLVRRLVDQYGGKVRVEDNEPTGAVFTVTLPKAD